MASLPTARSNRTRYHIYGTRATTSASEQRSIWSSVRLQIRVHLNQTHWPSDNRYIGGSDHPAMVLPCRRNHVARRQNDQLDTSLGLSVVVELVQCDSNLPRQVYQRGCEETEGNNKEHSNSILVLEV